VMPSKLRLAVRGAIAAEAIGIVRVKATAKVDGRQVVVGGRARISDGHWRTEIPLRWAKRHPRARVRITARFEGSSGVQGGAAERRLRL